MPHPFQKPLTRFVIGTLPEASDDEELTVEAQFNPRELQIKSPVTWKAHASIGAQSVATKPTEFVAMAPETMSVELTLDSFENNGTLVTDTVTTLRAMAGVRRPHSSKKGNTQRPSYCVATWGAQPPFRCVIESIDVKYTMFGTDGTPLRATVVIGLKSGRRPVDEGGETPFEQASMRRVTQQRQALLRERGR
ncbi:MAG: hypothetical protein ACKV2T_25160 [Kofleriaceae bacterium]